jgi:hypothetical protein
MKKLLFIAFISFFVNAKAQFTLEHTYDSAATYNVNIGGVQGSGQLMIIKFEVSGEQYVKINRWGKNISIYSLNHSLVQTISLAGVPLDPPYGTVSDVLYLSEHLFNTDPKKEFMYVHTFTDASGNGNFVTSIYDENGVMLFTDTAVPNIRMNIPLQQYPIYNSSQGTKMILSLTNGQAHVWGLQGTLTTTIQASSQSLLSASSLISNPHPNPTNSSTTIDYKMPNGINEGEIVFYDLKGNEIKRFKVDQTFDSLLISTTDIPAGTYYYQLQTTSNISQGRKLVIIK